MMIVSISTLIVLLGLLVALVVVVKEQNTVWAGMRA